MPVILHPKDEDLWLNPEVKADKLHLVLKPYPDVAMEEWEIGAAARDPKNDYPEIIEQHKSSRQGTLF